MAIPRNVFGLLAEAILECRAKKATKYLSKNEVVKATMQGRPRSNGRSMTILFTVGKPNYRERAFIQTAVKAGKRFPVRGIQLEWYRA